jgi:hemerythrin-like domain-containing protein
MDPRDEPAAHGGPDDRGHPVETLMDEHRIISAVLDAMDQEANHLAAGKPLRRDFWLRAADFVHTFADRCHHGKEEGLLFPALVECGMSDDHGPIAVMNHEHVDARALTTRFREAARDRNEREVVAAARAYTFLLREHIEKENNILFEMARQLLPPGLAEWLASSFARVEREVMGEHGSSAYADIARQLCAEAGVPFDPAR